MNQLKTPIIIMRKIALMHIFVLFGFSLIAQTPYNVTMQWDFYSSDPWRVELQGGQEQKKPFKQIRFKLTRLTPESVSDSCVSFADKSERTEIIICKKRFLHEKHSYDFNKTLIDGKIAIGCDGFSSIDDVKNNFHTELNGIVISNDTTGSVVNIINKGTPVFLHPSVLVQNGDCAIEMYKFRKYFRYLIVLRGGDGAGAYETYILVDLYNRGWIFIKDTNKETVSFLPVSAQKDPFSENGAKIWYKTILEMQK